MLTESTFLIPNVYHSAALEGVSLVTGSVDRDGYGGVKLLSFIAENTGIGTCWFQVFNGHAAPSAGAVPMISIKALTSQQVSQDLSGVNCIFCKNGIVIAQSSTGPTYTSQTGSAFITAFYI